MPGVEDFIRVLDNLYTRVFEQSPPKQNVRLSDVKVIREEATAPDLLAEGMAVVPVTARAYADLTLTGTTGANGDGTYEITSGKRIQYGRACCDFTNGVTVVVRFTTNFSSGSGSSHYLFSLDSSGNSHFVGYWSHTDGYFWVSLRVAGGTTYSTHIDPGAFSSGESFTLGIQYNGTDEIGISLNGSAWTTTAAGAITLTNMNTYFDVGSDDDATHADSDFAWVMIVSEYMDDTLIAELDALGDTDPVWEDYADPGDPHDIAFLWPCDDETHDPMSSVAGECNAVA